MIIEYSFSAALHFQDVNINIHTAYNNIMVALWMVRYMCVYITGKLIYIYNYAIDNLMSNLNG